MSHAKLKKVLSQCVNTCFHGATKRTRLAWNLRGLVPDPYLFIKLAVDSKLLEEYRCGTWVAATPELALWTEGGKR